MMTDFTAPMKRQSSERVTSARSTLTLIRPFVPLFEGWNQRAAKASAMALSHMSSAGERAHQGRILAELLREVDASYEEFEIAVMGAPPHSRIDDLRAAYRRLRDVLQHWR